MGPGLVWRDATGAFVAASTGIPSSSSLQFDQMLHYPYYFDAQDRVWRVDPETAQLTPTAYAGLVYVTPDCTGTAYVETLFPPRFAFMLYHESAYRVRKDQTRLSRIVVVSRKDNQNQGQCYGTGHMGTVAYVMPLNETTPVSNLPPVTFVGPLHLSTQ